MKSSYESQNHTKIRETKEALRQDALVYLKTGEVGQKLNRIIANFGAHVDIAKRIVNHSLSQSERKKIRQMA